LAIDPTPVATNAPFAIVFKLTNPRPSAVTVRITTSVQNYLWKQQAFRLNAGQTSVLEMRGAYSTPGNQILQATAALVIGATVTQTIGTREIGVRVYSAATAPKRPILFNPGPTQADQNDSITAPSPSGVVGTLTGSTNALFAVPKTGGVWRSLGGSAWLPLSNSPPRAFSLAVAPDETHIAVGEREDDVSDSRLGRSGLWESLDSGNTWTYTYDPSTVGSNQAIPAVAFSKVTSTLFMATSSGVARREVSPNTTKPFSQPVTLGVRKMADTDCHASNSTSDLGPVTAVITSETRAWARSTTELFFSDDDGKSWNCWTFPSTVDLPGQPNMQADFNNISATLVTDNANLAAFDDMAFIIFKPVGPGATNVTTLIKFDPATKQAIAQFTLDGDGRGKGGHRFVKAISIEARACSALSSQSIGLGRQVFVGTGQSVEQAISTDAAGRLVWDQVVGSSVAGPSTFTIDANGEVVARNCCDPTTTDCSKPGLPATCPASNTYGIHPDIWDFALPSDFCPPGKSSAYIANDGGVYQGIGSGSNIKISAMSWKLHSNDLHVQTAQSLGFAEAPPIQPGSSSLSYHLGYPTQDNDSWWRTNDGTWYPDSSQGDSNFIAADVGLDQAITWRTLEIASFYNPPSPVQSFVLNRDTQSVPQPLDGASVIQAVQTKVGDAQPSSLDMVMLVHLPLPDAKGNPVKDPPGGNGSGPRMALIRNSSFSTSFDGPANSFANWITVNDDIPAGAKRLWVSGGHQDTVFFLYTDSSNTSCPAGLTRLTFSIALHRSIWECLVKNLLDDQVSGDVVRQQGPAFVDPFDPQKIVVVTRGANPAPNALQITLDGGSHFCPLPALTALVTESGRYAIVGSYDPGLFSGPFLNASSRFHGFPLAVPSHISFNRHNGAYLLVASPFTGLYLGTVSANTARAGGCLESWQDLSPYLPSSRAYISGTGFVGDTALVTTEGRGAYAIYNQSTAQPASYFETNATVSAGAGFATLREANGAAIPWGSVAIAGRNLASQQPAPYGTLFRSDQTGRLTLPANYVPGQYVMDLRFEGNGTIAPSETKFLLTVQ
jgi:hypothetical protein